MKGMWRNGLWNMFVSGSCKQGSHKNVSATPFEEIIITLKWGRPSRGPPTQVNAAAIHLPARYLIKKNIYIWNWGRKRSETRSNWFIVGLWWMFKLKTTSTTQLTLRTPLFYKVTVQLLGWLTNSWAQFLHQPVGGCRDVIDVYHLCVGFYFHLLSLLCRSCA